MEANLKTLLANVRPEEVELQEVIIHEGSRVLHGGTIAVSDGIYSFEYLEVYSSFKSSGGAVYALPLAKVTPELLLDTYYGDLTMSSRYVSSSDYAYVRTAAVFNTPTSIAVFADSSANWLEVGIDKVIGYKRRYSKTSLAEITEAASKPNLLNNTWHASPKVRNQRGFDGNWGNLAVGAYGLDGWLKTSSTHKGFIVAAGSYKPSTNYIVIAEVGGILGEVTSPADGGNWSHSFPFAADKFVLREGSLPIGWHPDTDSKLDELNKDFIRDVNPTRNVPVNHVSGFGRWGIKVPKMRKTPIATIAVVGTYTNASAGTVDIVSDTGYRLSCTVTNTANPGWWYGMTIDLDATIALSEVTDDAEHRVVWG